MREAREFVFARVLYVTSPHCTLPTPTDNRSRAPGGLLLHTHCTSHRQSEQPQPERRKWGRTSAPEEATPTA